MGLFKSKIEKELEKKRLIKRTVYNMNKQIDALEEQKKVFVQKAVEAKKERAGSTVQPGAHGL